MVQQAGRSSSELEQGSSKTNCWLPKVAVAAAAAAVLVFQISTIRRRLAVVAVVPAEEVVAAAEHAETAMGTLAATEQDGS